MTNGMTHGMIELARGASRGLGAMAAAVLLGLGCGATDAGPNLPEAPVESGFVVIDDAFAFKNFGGRDPDAKVNANAAIRLFGAENVCATTTESTEPGECRLTPIAKEWMTHVNDAMVGGRCEGFAVLSGLMFLGETNPADFGATSPRDLHLEGNEPLAREIAYWFSTQYLRDVIENTTKPMTAVEALSFLTAEFAKQKDMYRIGLVRIDKDGRRQGGHAILAVGVEPTDVAGKFRIKVYDNNYADAERAILVDVPRNRWEYQASSNPDEEASLYSGTPANGNLLFLSPIKPRMGTHPCLFCAGDESEQSAALSQVFTLGSAEVEVTDAEGRTAGVINGKIVNHIPGALIPLTFPASTAMLLPTKGGARVTVRAVQGSEPVDVAVFGRGFSAGVKDAKNTVGRRDVLTLSEDGSGMNFVPSTISGPAIYIARATTKGTQTIVRLRLPEGLPVTSIAMAVDPETGDIAVEARGEGDIPLGVAVTRASADGEDSFEATLVAPAEGSVDIGVSEWEGEGTPMPVEVDEDGDGNAEEVVEVIPTGPVGESPAAPDALVATATELGKVGLAWHDNANSEESFELARDDGSGFVTLATTAPNTALYTDESVLSGTLYHYRVRAVNQYGASEWSAVADVMTLGCAAGAQDRDGDGTCEADCDHAGLACGAHGACTDASGTAACACDAGYAGAACDGCAAGYQDNDQDGTCAVTCATSGLACGAHGACADAGGTALCDCDIGYAGAACGACEVGYQDNDQDGVCAPTCAGAGLDCGSHGACTDAGGAAACACDAAYAGAACGVCAAGYQDNDANGTCTATCAGSGLACGAHGACTDAGGTAGCACDAGYAGAACEACAAGYQDNDQNGTCAVMCAGSGLACGAHGACADTAGTAACACDAGYAGAACEACAADYQDNDQNGTCAKTCAASGLACGTHGACADAGGTAGCACDAGYAGAACETCAAGYQDSDQNGTCAATCATSGLACGAHGACSDAAGAAACACDAGYAGAACAACAADYQDNDQNGTCAVTCAASGLACGTHGACADAGGTAGCDCDIGYAGAACEACAVDYQDNDQDGLCAPTCAGSGLGCGAHGACTDATGAAACACDAGYAGAACAACDADYQDNDQNGTCAKTCGASGLACGTHGACVDAGGTAACACDPAYAGAACDGCANGYQDNDQDGSCAATCATSGLACGAHGACTDTAGAAACACEAGYAGAACDGCANDYALVGGLCVIPSTSCDGAANCVVQLRNPSDFALRQAVMASGRAVLEANTAGYDTSGTFVVPAGVTSLDVYALGGGGGARGDWSTPGGGGAAAMRTFPVTPGQEIAFVVGAGGTGSTGGAATDGQDSTLTIDGVTMTGGKGKAGGVGGTATGGTINVAGGGADTAGAMSGSVCAAGGGASNVNLGLDKHRVGGAGGCFPAGGGGEGAPTWGPIPGGAYWASDGGYVTQPGGRGFSYGGGGGGGGNYSGRGGDGAGGYVRFAWAADPPSYVTETYGVVVTVGAQLATTGWVGVQRVVPDATTNGGAILYAASFDGRLTYRINDGSGWRRIVRAVSTDGAALAANNTLWQFNAAAAYGDEAWTASLSNSREGALQDAFAVSTNQWTQIVRLAGTEWGAANGFTAGTLDFAFGLRATSAAASPILRKVAVTACDANDGCRAPLEGLEHCWSGDGSGADDVSGNDATVGLDVTFTPGLSGSAFTCSGVSGGADQNVNVGGLPAIDPSGPWTYDFWINVTTAGGMAIDRTVPGTPLIDLYVEAGGDYWLIRLDDGTGVTLDTDFSRGRWHHLAVTRGGGVFKAYVDGTATSTVVDPGGSLTADPPRFCGHVSASNYWMAGQIDSFRISSRALSAAEIGVVAAGDGSCWADPRKLRGAVHDTLGRPVSGLTVHAWNADGTNAASTDASGGFAFSVPVGALDVELCVPGAWWSIMQDANTPANPQIPGLVKCVAAVPWAASLGTLSLTMPAASPITVSVTSDGQPAAGARITVDADLTSLPFAYLPGVNRTVGFMPLYGARTTDASGATDVQFYPSTGTTFSVTASLVVNGVTLSKTVSNIATTVTAVEVPLPPGPQQFSGSIHDTLGRPVKGLTVHAWNADGTAAANSDSDGNFSFYVPAGTVDVELCVPGAWWAIMQDANNPANPDIPGLVKCVTAVPWTSSDGPVALTLPTAKAITVNVTSDGQPASGASISVSADLVSDAFELLPGVSRTIGFMPLWGNRTTGASGAFDAMFYPTTGTTFNVTASKVVNGVTLSRTVSNISTDVASVEVALPGNPQQFSGSIHDTLGRPVGGLTVHAWNADGTAAANSDSGGNFAFYVPAGTVDVELCVPGAWWSIMQDANNPANPEIPGLVKCVTVAPWTGTDGPLALTMPAGGVITLHITNGGVPVSGASVGVATEITSTAFSVVAGATRTVAFIPLWGNRTSNASGDVSLAFYPSTGATFDVTATVVVDGVTLTGKLLRAPATLGASYTVAIPGTVDLGAP